MPASQSTMLDHFSPRHAPAASSSRRHPPPAPTEHSDSEGSDGLHNIRLGDPSLPPGHLLSQKRASKRIIADAEDGQGDETRSETSSHARPAAARYKGKGKARDPPRAPTIDDEDDQVSPMPPSAKTRSSSQKRPPPIQAPRSALAHTSRSPASSLRRTPIIELTRLTPKERASYSPFPSAPFVANEDLDELSSGQGTHRGTQTKTARKETTKQAVGKSRPKATRPGKPRPPGRLKKRTRDPDEKQDAEDEGDLVEDIALDEPERFKSKTRLRQRRETSVQRQLRKLTNRRNGVVESTTPESESADDSPDTESDFIVQDDGKRAELPHEFSNNAAQTPEYKFKVVFHYLVLLAVKGPKILPLKGEAKDYFRPQLLDIRRRLDGFRDGRVRSQIWRADLVSALKTFPDFKVEYLEFPENGCDACHMGGRRSSYRVYLEGDAYDRETHEADRSDSDSDSTQTPQVFLMGKYCKRRAEVYQAMSHWGEQGFTKLTLEDTLFQGIRRRYRDLLRARYRPVPDDSEASSSATDPEDDPEETQSRREQRTKRRARTTERVVRLRKEHLPENYRDADEILVWMDRRGDQNKACSLAALAHGRAFGGWRVSLTNRGISNTTIRATSSQTVLPESTDKAQVTSRKPAITLLPDPRRAADVIPVTESVDTGSTPLIVAAVADSNLSSDCLQTDSYAAEVRPGFNLVCRRS